MVIWLFFFFLFGSVRVGLSLVGVLSFRKMFDNIDPIQKIKKIKIKRQRRGKRKKNLTFKLAFVPLIPRPITSPSLTKTHPTGVSSLRSASSAMSMALRMKPAWYSRSGIGPKTISSLSPPLRERFVYGLEGEKGSDSSAVVGVGGRGTWVGEEGMAGVFCLSGFPLALAGAGALVGWCGDLGIGKERVCGLVVIDLWIGRSLFVSKMERV